MIRYQKLFDLNIFVPYQKKKHCIICFYSGVHHLTFYDAETIIVCRNNTNGPSIFVVFLNAWQVATYDCFLKHRLG